MREQLVEIDPVEGDLEAMAARVPVRVMRCRLDRARDGLAIGSRVADDEKRFVAGDAGQDVWQLADGASGSGVTRDEDRAVACRGFFIRRFEFDDFLLRRSAAAGVHCSHG